MSKLPDMSPLGFVEVQNHLKKTFDITSADDTEKVFGHRKNDTELQTILQINCKRSTLIKERIMSMFDILLVLKGLNDDSYIKTWLYNDYYGVIPIDTLSKPDGIDKIDAILFKITGGTIRMLRM